MLTILGAIAVTIMAGAYWLEDRSRWYTLIFAAASLATAAYSGLAEVYPIMAIAGGWSLLALQRFRTRPRGPSAERAGTTLVGATAASRPDQPAG